MLRRDQEETCAFKENQDGFHRSEKERNDANHLPLRCMYTKKITSGATVSTSMTGVEFVARNRHRERDLHAKDMFLLFLQRKRGLFLSGDQNP